MRRKEINTSRVPVYRDAGFELYNSELTAEAFRKETENKRSPDLYIYSRYRNPTVVAAEEDIMAIEGSEWAVLTQSGMSAVDVALSIFQNAGDNRPWLFFNEIYGGTISFAEMVLKKRRGIDIRYFYPSDERYNIEEFENYIKSVNPCLVYLETISNPMLIVPDAVSIIDISRHCGSAVIVDNTFATPYLWKPLDAGADLVIHSATKYLSGHGDLTGGVICGNNPELLKSIIEYRKFTGHMLSPDDAFRLSEQLKTFRLRFKQQCENAEGIASLLNQSESVRRVWFPGLPSHPTFSEAVSLFSRNGFGAMITFDFDGFDKDEKRKRRDSFIDAVSEKIKVIPSLGDYRTILLPVESVWGEKYPEPGMIRLSVGFENLNELVEIISFGLDTAGKKFEK